MKKWLVIVMLALWPLYLTNSTITDIDAALDNLRSDMHQHNTLDLSVLDSCGVITNNQGHGSCVAIRPDLILTAGHCINVMNGAWIEVDGQQYKILKQWKSEQYDVGFVEIEGELPFVELASRNPELLDEVFLIGTPRDRAFINNVTKGNVTKWIDIYADSVVNWSGNFVCDAMNYKGGSGGPVFYSCGRVAGIYVGLFTDGDNFSVCVPVAHIRQALEGYDARGE